MFLCLHASIIIFRPAGGVKGRNQIDKNEVDSESMHMSPESK